MNRRGMIFLTLGCYLLGLLTGCSPASINPGSGGSTPLVPATQFASPPQKAGVIGRQWEYPLLEGGPSSSGTEDYYQYNFKTETPLHKVWDFYAKKCGISDKFSIGSSSVASSTNGQNTKQTAYQSLKTDKLQMAAIAIQENSTRITITLSQAKGDKYTLVSFAVWTK